LSSHTLEQRRKPSVLVLLEPAFNEEVYITKYIPLLKKHIDFTLFKVHVIGSLSGSNALKEQLPGGLIHSVRFRPTSLRGLGLVLGYVAFLVNSFFKILQLIPGSDVDVLVSLGGHAYSGSIVAASARLLRKKSVVRISEPTRYIVEPRYRLGALISLVVSFMERVTLSISDVVVVNRDMHWYSSRIVKKQRLLSQGVDLSRFNPDVPPTFSSSNFPKLITVSRLDSQKNLESVIECVELLKDEYPEIRYYIVGSGPDENELRRKVSESAIDDNVCFHGYAKPEKIPGLLRSCDIFVLPSFIEGLPSAALEAMACRLPVVVGGPTKCGKTEWFVDERNAVVVDGDSQSIAEAVNQLVSDSQLRNTIVDNGLRDVREYHDSSKTKSKFSAIVLELQKCPECARIAHA